MLKRSILFVLMAFSGLSQASQLPVMQHAQTIENTAPAKTLATIKPENLIIKQISVAKTIAANNSKLDNKLSDYPLTGDVLARIYNSESSGNNKHYDVFQLKSGEEVGHWESFTYEKNNKHYITYITFMTEIDSCELPDYQNVKVGQVTYIKEGNEWVFDSLVKNIETFSFKDTVASSGYSEYPKVFFKSKNNIELFGIPEYFNAGGGLILVYLQMFSNRNTKWSYVGTLPVIADNSGGCGAGVGMYKDCLETEGRLIFNDKGNGMPSITIKANVKVKEENKKGGLEVVEEKIVELSTSFDEKTGKYTRIDFHDGDLNERD